MGLVQGPQGGGGGQKGWGEEEALRGLTIPAPQVLYRFFRSPGIF